jgi:hypothetical protein
LYVYGGQDCKQNIMNDLIVVDVGYQMSSTIQPAPCTHLPEPASQSMQPPQQQPPPPQPPLAPLPPLSPSPQKPPVASVATPTNAATQPPPSTPPASEQQAARRVTITNTTAPRLAHHSAVLYDRSLLLFGGRSTDSRISNTLYVIDTRM